MRGGSGGAVEGGADAARGKVMEDWLLVLTGAVDGALLMWAWMYARGVR